MPMKNRTKISPVLNPTITAGAYSIGDVVGGLLTFDFGTDRGGTFRGLYITDEDELNEAFTVYLFQSPPATIADNSAFVRTVADANNQVGVFTVAASDYASQDSIATGESLDWSFDFQSEDGKLYAYIVAATAISPSGTGKLHFRAAAWMD